MTDITIASPRSPRVARAGANTASSRILAYSSLCPSTLTVGGYVRLNSGYVYVPPAAAAEPMVFPAWIKAMLLCAGVCLLIAFGLALGSLIPGAQLLRVPSLLVLLVGASSMAVAFHAAKVRLRGKQS